MEIRRITLNDLEKVFEIMKQLYKESLNYDKFQEIYKLKLTDENSYYVVAIENKQIVGILTAELQMKLHRVKKQIFIEDLIVDENFRNRGIGKELLQNAINYADDKACDVVELTSYIDNEKAHKFYENNGFIKHSYKFKKYI